jgi:hypothetical protein
MGSAVRAGWLFMPACCRFRVPCRPAGFIPPCLAHQSAEPPSGAPWLHEIRTIGISRPILAALISAHRPFFTNHATTRALSGRVLCSAPTSAAVISTVAVIIPTVATIGVDPNPARADFDALGLRGGDSNYQRRSRK